MRLVRCDHCGAKALSAASQCPRCTQPLSLRDDRGGTVPLAHCRVCNTYYPRSTGACKWCGTAVSAPSSSRSLWAVAAVAALAVGTLFGWWYVRPRPPATREVVAAPVEVGSPSFPRTENPSLLLQQDTLSTAPPILAGSATSVAPESATQIVTGSAPDILPATTTATTPARAPAPSLAAGVKWRAAMANAYANVRAEARSDALIVGALSPNQRVQVGEVMKGWRRVKIGAVEGWADAKFLVAR